jgi:hypothetical protein
LVNPIVPSLNALRPVAQVSLRSLFRVRVPCPCLVKRYESRENSLFAAQKSFFDHFKTCFGAEIAKGPSWFRRPSEKIFDSRSELVFPLSRDLFIRILNFDISSSASNLRPLSLFPLSFDFAQDKLCSPLIDTPLLQQTSLKDNRVPQKSGNSGFSLL